MSLLKERFGAELLKVPDLESLWIPLESPFWMKVIRCYRDNFDLLLFRDDLGQMKPIKFRVRTVSMSSSFDRVFEIIEEEQARILALEVHES